MPIIKKCTKHPRPNIIINVVQNSATDVARIEPSNIVTLQRIVDVIEVDIKAEPFSRLKRSTFLVTDVPL